MLHLKPFLKHEFTEGICINHRFRLTGDRSWFTWGHTHRS